MATAGAFAILLIAATAISIALAYAGRQLADRAIVAETRAKAEGEKSSRSAAESGAVLQFFQDNLLAATRPVGWLGGLGRDATIRKAVEAAEPKIATYSRISRLRRRIYACARPSIFVLGRAPGRDTRDDACVGVLLGQLGPDHEDTLRSRDSLADSYRTVGRIDEAIALLESNVKTWKVKLSARQPPHSQLPSLSRRSRTSVQADGGERRSQGGRDMPRSGGASSRGGIIPPRSKPAKTSASHISRPDASTMRSRSLQPSRPRKEFLV